MHGTWLFCRGSAQSTYKMCLQWKVVQAHILKYQHHLQFLILLFSTASNYIEYAHKVRKFEEKVDICDAQLL